MSSRPTGARAGAKARAHEKELREFALAYPETHEDMPWGHRAMKVRKKKAFVFMGLNDDGFFVCVKLPHSNTEALDQDFAEPTGYGLGKSGWVTAQFGMDEDVPVELMKAWIDESFRAIAPKTLVKAMDAGAGTAGTGPASKKAGSKQTATRKPAKAGTRKSAAKSPSRKSAKRSPKR
jgi:predicted DNA-binding protein (MmcQ/YjbR family)